MKINRIKMCKGKVSFTNAGAAKRVAEKHGQRVYECPVCFCFHCTSKADWRDEFVPIEQYRLIVQKLEDLQKKYKEKTCRLGGEISNKNHIIKEMKKKMPRVPAPNTCPHGDNWDDCPDCRH